MPSSIFTNWITKELVREPFDVFQNQADVPCVAQCLTERLKRCFMHPWMAMVYHIIMCTYLVRCVNWMNGCVCVWKRQICAINLCANVIYMVRLADALNRQICSLHHFIADSVQSDYFRLTRSLYCKHYDSYCYCYILCCIVCEWNSDGSSHPIITASGIKTKLLKI